MESAIIARPPWGLIVPAIASALAGTSIVINWPDRPSPNSLPVVMETIVSAVVVPVVPVPMIVSAQLGLVALPVIVPTIDRLVAQSDATQIAAHVATSDALEAMTPRQAESLVLFGKRIGLPLLYLRRLNPQLRGFDDNEPLPAETVVVVPSLGH